MKPGDLLGGGAFRWLTRGVLLGALLVVLALRFLLHVNIFLAVIAGTSVLLLGLLLVWILLSTGRVRLKL